MSPQHWKAVLPFVQAFAEGKTLQQKLLTGEWKTLTDPYFSGNPKTYRIKPITIKSRRYLWKNDAGFFTISIINNPATEQLKWLQDWEYFVKWIDEDWVEHELPTTAETVK